MRTDVYLDVQVVDNDNAILEEKKIMLSGHISIKAIEEKMKNKSRNYNSSKRSKCIKFPEVIKVPKMNDRKYIYDYEISDISV